MIFVAIPCFRTREQILQVIKAIPAKVEKILVIDDACPQNTGHWVTENCKDPRVKVVFHKKNLGVGGAMVTAYKEALATGASVIVKVDGDNQMDPQLIPRLIRPINLGLADYVKGNRFYSLTHLKSMPRFRLFGNAILSFFSKATTGYWSLMDPTNGFTAIHREALIQLPLDKIEKRFFFETDMLFQLNLARAVVLEMPMFAKYGDENSNLRVLQQIPVFLFKHLQRILKRLVYSYFIRDFSIGTVEFIGSFLLLSFGISFGVYRWALSIQENIPATTGTVMLAALPILIGFQLLLSAISFDVSSMPTMPLQKLAPNLNTSKDC